MNEQIETVEATDELTTGQEIVLDNAAAETYFINETFTLLKEIIEIKAAARFHKIKGQNLKERMIYELSKWDEWTPDNEFEEHNVLRASKAGLLRFHSRQEKKYITQAKRLIAHLNTRLSQ